MRTKGDLEGGFLDNDGFMYRYNFNAADNSLVYSATDQFHKALKFKITDKNIVNKFLKDIKKVSDIPGYKMPHINFIKNNVKNYITSHIPTDKNNKYFIDLNVADVAVDNDHSNYKRMEYIVKQMARKDLLKEMKINKPNTDCSNLSDHDLKNVVITHRINSKSWKHSDPVPGRSNAFKDLFAAVEANNLLKKYFSETAIIDKNDVKLHPEIINKVSNHNKLINEIKTSIVNGLLNGDSVLLQARKHIDNTSGVDYSCNTQTKKPFEDIQQLYLQQERKNKSYESPYFMPSSDVRKNGFTIKNKSLASITSHINKSNSQIEFSYFYNGDQLVQNNRTLDVAKTLVNSNPEIPYVKTQEEIPPIKTYDARSFSLVEGFTSYISNYFKSIYTGEEYTPPNYTKEEINSLVSYINNSMFFKNVKEAHKTVKNSMLTPVKQKQHDHARRR